MINIRVILYRIAEFLAWGTLISILFMGLLGCVILMWKIIFTGQC